MIPDPSKLEPIPETPKLFKKKKFQMKKPGQRKKKKIAEDRFGHERPEAVEEKKTKKSSLNNVPNCQMTNKLS